MPVTEPEVSGSAFDELMGECGYEMSEDGVFMGITDEYEDEDEPTSPRGSTSA
jgi:hypothetical protein